MLAGSDRGAVSSRRRDAVTAAAALLGHAALLALAFVVHRSEPAPPPPQDEVEPGAIIELSVVSLDPPPVTPIPAASTEATAGAALRDVGGTTGPGREALPELPAPAQPEVAPAPVASTTAAPAATGELYGPAPAVPVAGGGLTFGTPVWAVPGAVPGGAGAPGGTGTAGPPGPVGPRMAQAPGKQVLRDTMLGRDRELGLGNPGATAVANAVADAVRASTVPPETSAMIVARIGGDGVILSVGVQQFSSGDVRSWNGVAQAATAALGKKKLGLAGLGPGGAVVQVNVRSAVTLPSGAKSPVQGRLPSLTEGPPRDVMPAPSPDGDSCAPERWSDLKPTCGVGAKVGTFDLADMVAKPHRSVKVSFGVKLLDEALALATPASPASATPLSPSAVPSAPAAKTAPDAGAP